MKLTQDEVRTIQELIESCENCDEGKCFQCRRRSKSQVLDMSCENKLFKDVVKFLEGLLKSNGIQ